MITDKTMKMHVDRLMMLGVDAGVFIKFASFVNSAVDMSNDSNCPFQDSACEFLQALERVSSIIHSVSGE